MILGSDRAWIAGFYEGEGYVGVQRQIAQGRKAVSRHLKLAIAQKEKSILAWIQKIVGFGHLYPDRKQNSWKLTFHSSYALEFCSIIAPYMRSRKKIRQMTKALVEAKTINHRPLSELKRY